MISPQAASDATPVPRDGEPERARNSDTDSGWLLVGKLAPPEQRVTVAMRGELLRRLDEGLGKPLSVVVSPPGFGKTTLLTQWWRALADRPDVATCWLTVDELDSEVSRFAAGIVLALAQAGVDVGPLEAAARQQAIDPNVRPIMLALLSAIRNSGRRAILILDDFHRARSSAVDEAVETLIDNAHGELHLVVSGRHRPAFHMSALWARGLVTMLDAGDLALSLEEAAQVLGADVSASDLATLHARTEGWAVALQLARLWLERGHRHPDTLREFHGRTSEMTDYLAEQVVEDLPAELRDFLLETSILERFDAALADAVRDRHDSADMLERLGHFDALLVPLDGSRDWFRYHRMFADFLHQRLRRGSGNRVASLHRRAALALAAFGDLPEAVQHALEADDTGLAIELTQAAGGWELILWRGIGYVRSLLSTFDDLTIRSAPTLQLTQAYLHLKLARFDDAREMLALAEASLEAAPARVRRDYNFVQALFRIYIDEVGEADWQRMVEAQLDLLDSSDHLGRGTLLCGMAVTTLATGDVGRAEADSRLAVREMRAAGSVLGTNYALLHLAQSQMLQGKLREAESLFSEALAVAEDNFGADSGLKALSSTFLGYCMHLRGDAEGARRLLESSFATTDGWLDVFATAYELRARYAFASDGLPGAMDVVAEATRTARNRHIDRLGRMAAAWRVEYLALAGNLQDARREAQAAGVFAAAEAGGQPNFRWRVRYAATQAVARLWTASGATAQSLQLLDGVVAQFRDVNLLLPANRLDLLAVAVLKQRGASEEALLRLQPLLEFAVTEGAAGLLLEQGPALASLLHAAQRRNRELLLSGEQRTLITRVLVQMQRGQPGDPEGFSGRELEVLRELCHGRSNKAIGQLLDLSENTVKFHMKRIFRKLGADSRSSAIATALQRHLVEPEDPGKKPGRT